MTDKKENIVHFTIPDIRMVQPICIKNKNDVGFNRLQQIEKFKKQGKSYEFFSPNNISLFVSVAKRELKNAKNIFNQIHSEKISKNSYVTFNEKEIKTLYDYFESIQVSIIFSYIAVEAFSNAAIPNSFVLKKTNNKGVREIWDKSSIERWYSTSEKLISILPNTLKTDSPKDTAFWDDFKKLEKLRNQLVHLKTTDKVYALDRNFFKNFFHKNIFKTVESGFKIIQYFNNNTQARFFIPIELSNKKVDILSFNEFEKHFKVNKSK